MIGNYNTMVHGRKSWRGWIEWWPATAIVVLWGTLSPRRRVMGYRVQKLRIPHQDWFREDFRALLELLREGKIHPVVAERLPLSEARRAHEMLERSAATGLVLRRASHSELCPRAKLTRRARTPPVHPQRVGGWSGLEGGPLEIGMGGAGSVTPCYRCRRNRSARRPSPVETQPMPLEAGIDDWTSMTTQPTRVEAAAARWRRFRTPHGRLQCTT